MFRGLNLPVRGVGVAPFRADDSGVLQLPSRKPGSEKLLRPTIGARGVEVADAEPPGFVKDGMGALAHARGIALWTKIVLAPEVAVTGPAQRREPKSQPRYRQA